MRAATALFGDRAPPGRRRFGLDAGQYPLLRSEFGFLRSPGLALRGPILVMPDPGSRRGASEGRS